MSYNISKIKNVLSCYLNHFDPNPYPDSLPILEHGDFLLSKPVPIARYLAFLTGLAGQDDLEQAQVDMIVDHVQDFQKREFIIAAIFSMKKLVNT